MMQRGHILHNIGKFRRKYRTAHASIIIQPPNARAHHSRHHYSVIFSFHNYDGMLCPANTSTIGFDGDL